MKQPFNEFKIYLSSDDKPTRWEVYHTGTNLKCHERVRSILTAIYEQQLNEGYPILLLFKDKNETEYYLNYFKDKYPNRAGYCHNFYYDKIENYEGEDGNIYNEAYLCSYHIKLGLDKG